MTYENEAKRVREIARAEAWHRGVAMTFDDVHRHVPHLSVLFVAQQCEMAGFPVWTASPLFM